MASFYGWVTLMNSVRAYFLDELSALSFKSVENTV